MCETGLLKIGAVVSWALVSLSGMELHGADPSSGGMVRVTTLAEDSLALELAELAPGQLERLRQGRKQRLLELNPLVLPEAPHIVGKNTHFGWPVATRAGKTLVVIYLRRRKHYLAPQFDQDSSGMMVTRSVDGGKRWSLPVDVREQFPNADGSLPGYSKSESITTTADGAIVVGHKGGTFRSEDQGQTWKHFPHAFRKEVEPGVHVRLNCPRMIEHPDYGLVRMEGTHLAAEFPGWPHSGNRMATGFSRDGGKTWQEQLHPVPIGGSAEPAMLLHDGALFMVGRPHDVVAYDAETHTSHYMQYWSRTGWFPLQAKRTNIRTTDRLKSGRPGKGFDTVDLGFNPRTKRLEVIATDRMGGGVEGRFWDVKFALNLWSIDPQAMLSGSAEWRFEGCLLQRNKPMTIPYRFGMSDGCHPAAAVMDPEQGVQHIFIYLGSPNGPAGIFHMKRSLDTPRLAEFLRETQGRAGQ